MTKKSVYLQFLQMINSLQEIKVTKVIDSRLGSVDWDNLPFGKVFSDHMLVMDYRDGAWSNPEIVPFERMSFHPATSAIHYGQSIFEGMKAYRSLTDEVALFRPDMNARRFKISCDRMCMPAISEDMFLYCVEQLVSLDRNWIPSRKGYSLYIRPFMFATDDYIGIKPSDTYKFMIFTCPVGHYYAQPLTVKIEEHFTRASIGGVGRAKTAGNYAASLYPAKMAKMEGFDQLIWTDGIEHKYIEESGTMNIMFVIDGKLISPSEDSDTILRGITKRSVIEIARDWGMTVEERQVSVKEIIESIKNGSLTEAFGAGTAATIAQIQRIGYRGELFNLPEIESREFSHKVYAHLNNIKSGEVTDAFNWIRKVN